MDVMENIAIIKDEIKGGLGANIFLPKDVAKDFAAAFLDEDVCRHWIIKHLHPESAPTCPNCHTDISDRVLPRYWEGGRICCNTCGKFFTALTGTFLNGCHLNFSGVFLLALFLGINVPLGIVATKLDISEETARLWRNKFRSMKQLRTIEGENGTT